MKILVYPHDLGMGGSQINALELAGAVRDLGHDVHVFGQPGPLAPVIDRLGLDFIEAPRVRLRPTPSVVAALRRAVRARGIEVVHGYEWPPALEAHLAAYGMPGVTAVSTVMSMAVAPFIPRRMPLVVGTEQIAAAERAAGRSQVDVLEPPVDTRWNDRDRTDLDVRGFIARWGLDPQGVRVVIVSRLAHEMKLEGILTAISVVGRFAGPPSVQLVVVGDGPAADQVRRAAERANRRAGRTVVVLTGEVADPRPAYASADISLGMGSSALRAMAFGVPLIVQGERGFWQVLTADTLPTFLWQGFYGAGTQPEKGEMILTDSIARLVKSPEDRQELGEFGRAVVRDRFSLRAAARRQCDVYERARAVRTGVSAGVRSDLGAAVRFASYFTRSQATRLRGIAAGDDFNASPVAARPSLPDGAR